jgi:drug/metabolite transporter (DMT)-like permease
MAFVAFGVFAFHDALIKVLGGHYSVFQIMLFSSLFAFIPTTTLMLADRKPENFHPRHPWWVTLRTVLGLAGAAGAFTAFSRLPLAEAYALIFATPLLITLLAVPMLGEKVGPARVGAVVVGLIGVLVVLRPGYTHFGLGHAGALAAAVFSSIATIIMRKIGREERSAVLILFPMIAGIISMGAIMPLVYKPIDLPHLAILAATGLLVVLGQLASIAAYRAAPAAYVAPIQYSQIIWAIGLGYVMFGEVPDIWVALGILIIIGSGLFILFRESRGGRSQHRPVSDSPATGSSSRLPMQVGGTAAE